MEWKTTLGSTLFSTVVNPDHLVDVTEVAECIAGAASVPELALLRRFAPRRPIPAAAYGTLVNSMFDLLADDPDLTDEEVLNLSLSQRRLTWEALRASGEPVDNLVDKAAALLTRLREQINIWGAGNITTEAAAACPALGLQGRLDIVVRPPSGTDTAPQLIELKAGKPPSSGTRPSHEAQAAAYALMMEAVEGSPPGRTSIWYAAADREPFRPIDANEGSVRELQQRIIQTRNAIVELDMRLADRDFGILRSFDGTRTMAAGLAAEFEREFAHVYRSVDQVSRTAFQAWVSFLERERAALHSAEPESRFVISGLRPTQADGHYTRLSRPDPIDASSIRVGDMVRLSLEGADHSQGYFLVKGTVREFGSDHVVVSLRNASRGLDPSATYLLEQDTTDAGLKQVYPSLFRFLEAPERRRRILLGLEPPRITSPRPLSLPGLHADQATIIARALASDDYFLLQGPPGTGKTSIMLKNIVGQLVADPKERILVAAFTNRAVTEICDVLSSALPHGSFYRHGPGGRDQGHNGPPSAPVVVSTIAALHSSAEIFSFGAFTTAVIDEAAQVVEANLIGILAAVGRCILIGDHAQLPAVVTQDPAGLDISAPVLADIHLSNLGMSTFERLFLCCEINGWEGATATLSTQGRMHADVADFASRAFYGGKLQPLMEWQRDPSPLPWHEFLPERAVFQNVVNGVDGEVDAIVHIVENVLKSAADHGRDVTIGVITPFRTQNRRLQLALQHIENTKVTIDTVERFQGSQRDVIIFGAAVENVGDLASIRSEAHVHGRLVDRKLNVALTRAREQFVLVGNADILRRSVVYEQAINSLKHLN